MLPQTLLSAKRPLGRLERVELRSVWQGESVHFTPWLAQDENIALLGEAVGMDLAVESTEKGVGPFRADILCKETTSGHYVLIENQLESTDHIHLGQLLTYAAGLEAATIIWVARRFTDEHRAALDWLNSATKPGFDFFGLEIELWRIGDSPPAPKFNIASKPNDWSRSVRESAGQGQGGGLSETKQLHLEFWTQFKQYLEERKSRIRFGKPTADHWKTLGVGRSYFALQAVNGMRDGFSGVNLSLTGPYSKPHFHLLRQRYQADVEAKLEPLVWRELPHNVESQISLTRKSTPSNRATWPELNEWFATTLEKMYAVFNPLVTTLDASDYAPPDVVPTPALDNEE